MYISEYFSLMDLDTTYHDSCNNSVGKILRYQKQILVLKGAIEGSNDYYRIVRAMSPQIQRLKMLSKEQKQVTWKQDFGRISANDKKVCVRHLELVKARIMARRAKTVQKISR